MYMTGKQKEKILWTSTIIVVAIIYSQTLSSSIFAGDSGDLASAAIVKGIAHPPGYPLYLILAQIPLIFTFGTPALKVGIISLLSGVLTVYIVGLCVYKISAKLAPAICSALIFAFLSPFWLYSSVVEVFTLNTLFASLITLISFNIYFAQKASLKLWCLLVFVTGLSLTHHHTIVLIFPGIIYLLYPKAKSQFKLLKRKIFFIFIFFFLGICPYLYIPIAASFNPVVNWGDPSTLKGFSSVIFRSDYGTFQAVRGVFGNASQHFVQLIWYFKLFLTDFTFIGVLLAIFGFLFSFIQNRRIAITLLLCYLFSGPLFLFYANFHLNSTFQLGVTERFVLLSYLYASILVGLGLVGFSLLLKNLSLNKISVNRNIIIICFEILIFLFPVYLFFNNFPKTNLKSVYLGDVLAYDILSTPESDNSIIFLQDDTIVFNTKYYYYAYNYRPRLKLISGSIRTREFRQNLRQLHPDLNIPSEEETKNLSQAEIFKEIIKRNLENYEIYTYIGGPEIIDWGWVPYGILVRLIKEDTENNIVFRDNQEKVWEKYKFNAENDSKVYRNFFIDHLLVIYKTGYINTGINLYKSSLFQEAGHYFNKSLVVDENYDLAKVWLGKNLNQLGKCLESEEVLNGVPDYSADYQIALYNLQNTYIQCFKDPVRANMISNKLETLKKTKEIPLDKF